MKIAVFCKDRANLSFIRAAAHLKRYERLSYLNLAMLLLNRNHEKPVYHTKISILRIRGFLNKHYRIVITNESENGLACIILRRWRLIGAPWFGPNTRLKVKIIGDSNNFKIKYRFFYPEYIFFWILSMLIATGSVLSANQPPRFFKIFSGFVTFIILAAFFSLIVFIDTKFFDVRFKILLADF